MQIEKDNEGNMILRPVTEWITGTVAGVAVLLGIRYSETPEDIDTGKSVQFVLTPQQSLELAATLTKLAKRVLDPSETGTRPS